MIFRCHTFRRAVLGRYTWLIVPATALSWHSQRQSGPPHRPTDQRLPIIVFSPSEHRLSLIDHVWECILTAKRFIYLLFLFMPVLISSPMLLVGKPQKSLKWGAVWWYGLLVSRMEAAGPTFIKLAQWAASRADLFPSFLCERLGTLHSNGKPHAFAHTKTVIQTVFQRQFDHVFESFDRHPIGTGAIAQVYKANLNRDLIPPSYLGPRRTRRSPGGSLGPVILQDPLPSVPTATVAIKVLHPDVEAYIDRDLRIMYFFARCVNLLPGMQWLSLPEEVQVFGSMMRRQLDLQNEADNLATFEANFAPRRISVNFPRPLKVWSSKDVLVEEHVNAVPLENFLRNGGGPFDEQIATVGLDAFLHMLLMDNFVHADLHPGNIMIKFSKPPTTRMLLENIYAYFTKSRTDEHGHPTSSMILADYSDSDSIVARLRSVVDTPDKWHEELDQLHERGYVPEIVFLDAGLITCLDGKNRQNFLDLFRAIAEFDGYRAGQLMIERSRSPELAINTETFALKMQHLVLSVKRKTFSLGQIKISDILTEVLKNVREHHVKMEGDFINTVISVLLLEGIGRQLDSDLDLFASALPILRKLGSQMAMTSKELPVPSTDLGLLFKFWIWLEARSLITSAIVNADDLVKYDLLTPSV